MVKTTLRKPSTWIVILLVAIIAISIIPAVKNIKVPLNETDVYCLTRNAYYEAKGDSQMSQIAVTHVVLNRMNDPKFPKKACEVIYQKNSKDANSTVCQFSWYCDKRMMTRVIDSKAWEQSYEAVMKAVKIYYHKGVDVTEGSTFYHANYVNPGWHRLERVTSIGSHIYYKESEYNGSTRRPVYEKVVFRTN
jgi:spore germination cell wall hydrolase CwlJ-like protein